MKAGGSGIIIVNYTQLLGKFEASLALMGPCLKTSSEEVERLDPADVLSRGPMGGGNRESSRRETGEEKQNGQDAEEWMTVAPGL